MSNWSEWVNIDFAKSEKGQFSHLGIYQIRAVTPSGVPIPVCRLVGVDHLGILYIGRSGFKPERSIANRIKEFVQRQHSGGITYAKAKRVLDKTPTYLWHCLQVRAKSLSTKEEIESAERDALDEYFSKHGELPPCNSAKPRQNRCGEISNAARLVF